MAATSSSLGGAAGAPGYPTPGSMAPSAPPSPLQVRPLTTADLAQAVVFLTNAMACLSQTVQVLASQTGQPQVVQAAKVTSQSLGKIIAHPSSWDGKGDSAAARHFLAAFSNWAYAQKDKMNVELSNGQWHQRNMDWIQAVLNLMSGEAQTWALPTLEDLRDGRDPYRGAWWEFEEQFTCRFIPLDPAQAAREVLKKLKQGKMSVAEYKAKFDKQSSLTKWSLVDLRTCFYDGLSNSIKDTLAITDRPIETLTELFESTQVMDTRMRQRAAEKKGQTFHQQSKSQDPLGVVPMDLDAMCQGQSKQRGQNQQSSGSGKNRASWMKQMTGKCFGCGSTEHTKKNGGHDQEICHHCQKAGHRTNVCFDKYMGKEKKAKAASMQQAASTFSGQAQVALTSTPSPAPSSSQGKLVKLLMEQQKALSEQLEALKSSF